MHTRAALSVAVAALLLTTPARSQDLSGTYAVSGNGSTVTLILRQAGNGQLTGTLRGNTTFRFAGQAQGSQFAGFASNDAGRIYIEGQLEGTQLAVAMAEVDQNGQPQPQTARTVVMQRVGAAGTGETGQAAAPSPNRGRGAGAGPGAAGAPAAPKGDRAIAASAQDRQIAQLLLRSAWCSFSYSGVSGTSSGTTRTERVVFRPDGSGARQSGSESYYSGQAGSVAGQSSGGEPFRWQVRSGVLLTTSDGVNWGQTPLRITTNSNGYPIITAEGKEYMMCN